MVYDNFTTFDKLIKGEKHAAKTCLYDHYNLIDSVCML